ncbi:hypothetical protein ACLMJK_002140 [Lecanora helva]
MGGSGEPEILVKVRVEETHGGFAVDEHKILVSEVVNERLAGPFVSVPIRNDGEDQIELSGVTSQDVALEIDVLQDLPMRLQPGQSKSLNLRISLNNSPPPPIAQLAIACLRAGGHNYLFESTVSVIFSRKRLNSPHRFTFLHKSGVISYAILRPPQEDLFHGMEPVKQLPILLNLHGAGLEADSQQLRSTFDLLPDLAAWVLFPSGVSPWCGDDWRANFPGYTLRFLTDCRPDTWGFADVEASVAAIKDWIKAVKWQGPSVNTCKWLVSGHSNGGYVPYGMWTELDPRINFLLQDSLKSFRHELLVENCSAVPLLLQHGSGDDNVPAFHSRRMNQLVSQSREDKPSGYTEFKGKGHWFDGIMVTAPLRAFYHKILHSEASWPELPLGFSIVVANPSDMGPRGGLIVDQLVDPGCLGKIRVTRHPATSSWTLRTSNIYRFHFTHSNFTTTPSMVEIDKDSLALPAARTLNPAWLVRSNGGHWRVSDDETWLLKERHGAQLGTLDAITRSHGCFLIRFQPSSIYHFALQVSRNLYQYLSADSEIVEVTSDENDMNGNNGNIISLGISGSFPSSPYAKSFPIQILEDQGLSIRTSDSVLTVFEFQEGLGVIMLRPLPRERLELVIWGFDIFGLRSASRLLPILTGVAQPEFVVVSKRCSWQGAGGVLAMGSFDRHWNVTQSSFIT